jgi:hypothetical protein
MSNGAITQHHYYQHILLPLKYYHSNIINELLHIINHHIYTPMLILSKSQAKNYYKKLKPSYYSEGCGCCNGHITYEIRNNRILCISSGEHQGTSYLDVTVKAKIRKVRSN